MDDKSGSIALTLHAIDPERLDVDALSDAISAAVSVAPNIELQVVVSGDFEHYVREHDSWATGREYRQDRLVGHAVAKIVECADGSVQLLVDASVLDLDRDEDDSPTRTFVHEMLHLAAGQRGETLNGRRARLGYEQGSAIGSFAGMAGIAGEEFRVERALADLGQPLADHYRTELNTFIDAYIDSLREPLREWEETGEVIPLHNAALAGFEQLMTVVAYVIADDLGSNGRRVPDLGGRDSRWVASSYLRLREALVALPSASEAMPIGDLDRLAEPVSEELVAWLLRIGFALHDLSEHEVFFEVLDPDGLRAAIGDG